MTRLLPPRPFLDQIAFRVLMVWGFLRLVASLESSDPFPESVAGHPVTLLWIVIVVAAALRFEMARQSELVLLANLGYSFARISGLIAVECAALDVTLRLLVV